MWTFYRSHEAGKKLRRPKKRFCIRLENMFSAVEHFNMEVYEE